MVIFFFLNVRLVRNILTIVTPEQASAILAAGTRWDGTGWNTTRAAKALYDICNVALVTGEVRTYKEAFLFGCALSWGVEVPDVTLSDKVAGRCILPFGRS